MRATNMLRSLVSGFIILITLLASVHSYAQDQSRYLLQNPLFTQDAQAAIDYVYNQQYDEANEVLRPWREEYENHPVWTFWEGLPLWWNVLADLSNEAHDDEFLGIMEQAVRQSDRNLRQDRRNLDAMVVNALSHGFMARVHANRSNWFKSFNHGRAAVNMLFSLERLYPEIHDLQFGMGLYLYFTEYLSEEYRLVRAVSWMLPSGDRKEGIERLQDAAENSTFMIPESKYFLGHIFLHYENNYQEAETYLRDLHTKYDQNPFFSRLLLRNKYRTRQFEDAYVICTEIFEKFDHDQAGELELNTLEEANLIAGVIMLRGYEQGKARAYLERSIEIGSNLHGGERREMQLRAQYQLARAAVRENENDEARGILQKIIRHRVDSPVTERAKNLLARIES